MTRYKASISFDTSAGHPDAPDSNNLSFDDVYTIDPGAFYGLEDIQDYIKQDLLLVAGGGYDWKHVKNYKFKIVQE